MQDVAAESSTSGDNSENQNPTQVPVNTTEDTETSNQETRERDTSAAIKEKPGSSNQGEEKPGSSNQGEEKPGSSNQGEEKPGSSNQSEEKPGSSNQSEEKPGSSNQGEVKPGSSNQGEEKTDHQSTLTVNKTFVVNTLKQATDHNRYKTTQESKHLRKFQNEQRKKHTVQNLSNSFSPRKTLYSDLITVVPVRKNGQLVEKESKIITPFEQVQKLVSEAAKFDAMHEPGPARLARKSSRVMVDKTLLRNHLRHTSVHNRLQEEAEMWEQHDSTTSKLSLRTKSVGERSAADRGGGMYADREGSNVKVTRVKPTPDPVAQRLFGSATRKLLELEKKMPDRWGHDGFKEVYVNELYNPTALSKANRQAKASRKIVVRNSVRDRLNSSIELSDEDETRDRVKRRKIVHEDSGDDDVVVVSRIKRTIKQNTRQVNLESEESLEELDDSDEEEVDTRKRSVITVVPQKKAPKRRQQGPEIAKKKTPKRTLGTLQSDMIKERKISPQGANRRDSISGRWGHDGFKKLVDDEALSIHSDEDVQPRGKFLKKCPAKNRIGALEVRDSEDSSQEVNADRNAVLNRISKVKKQIQRQSQPPKNVNITKKTIVRKKVIVPKKNVSQKMKIVPKKRAVQATSSPVQLSESEEAEEWTEKSEVDRTTLKNSIHEDRGESSKRPSVKSRLGQRRRDPSSDGSSFTDSSDDEPNIKRRLGRR